MGQRTNIRAHDCIPSPEWWKHQRPANKRKFWKKVRTTNRAKLRVFLKCLPLLLLLASPVMGQKCGVERWPVKTLADSEGSQVMALTPVSGEISALVKKKPPNRSDLQKAVSDRFPSEKKQYQVDALVLGFKHEADSDFHIVLADPKNPKVTMIAEIPAAGCVQDKDYQAYFGTLQKHFEQQFGQPTAKYRKLTVPVHVTVKGVFFFDFLHGQTGVAPNGAELHPVLAIDKASPSK